MNRSMRTSASLIALSLALAGCSTSLFESKRIDYKSAKQMPQTLEIPPDLTAPTRDDRFAVPDVSPRGVATYSAYNADRSGQPSAAGATDVLATPDTMRIERAGSQRWLVVAGVPEQLWPEIKDFWLELGFILNVDSPEIGVMETDWAEDRAKIPQDFIRSTLGKVLDGMFSTPERDKFRTRLEKGKDAGTVEIYISHRGMMEIYPTEAKDSTIWQPRPADPELEAEMLRRLMVRLGAEEARADAALSSAPTAERARITAGIDPIWFGIFVVLVVEMAQITPPVGFNLFVLQGMTGRQLPWIAKVAMPMFLLMCGAVALIYVFPGIVTWLPQQMSAR